MNQMKKSIIVSEFYADSLIQISEVLSKIEEIEYQTISFIPGRWDGEIIAANTTKELSRGDIVSYKCIVTFRKIFTPDQITSKELTEKIRQNQRK